VVRELLAEFGDELRYVFRHLPLEDVHPHAQLAAEAAEAAGAQGRFWEMHDLLFAHQDALEPADLRRYAEELGLDVDRFWEEVRSRAHARRIAEDVRSAEESGVAGTPTFFVNGRRHQGAYDAETLGAAVRLARHRAQLGTAASPRQIDYG
jgi:protein-disulfide isomerase